MLREISGVFAIIAAVSAAEAAAQSVKSTVIASNGIEVTVYSDDFANRYEYSSPSIKSGDGFMSVISVKKNGNTSPAELSGGFVYTGEWRRYHTAVYKGGDAADFKERGREVGRCFSSRYSAASCTLIESFTVSLPATGLSKRIENGAFAIQIRAQDTSAVIFEIPLSYVEAVKEVAQRSK